jgi:hypothetical protein
MFFKVCGSVLSVMYQDIRAFKKIQYFFVFFFCRFLPIKSCFLTVTWILGVCRKEITERLMIKGSYNRFTLILKTVTKAKYGMI